ncbi:fructose-1,6-bisphosphatase II [Agromyces terreus]|uniref:Fructose-1,6-bisphosphatase class 2 n=1 Tax=Agromyces terreus TaxID=424795 RepID=A0A9X2HAK2_9MICO|nr:fructose-bisphosphatase class II [Agromyces terreus]MCP2372449.1 fructose-1,6-bisphosphatase II [Agromyces terreus]
MTPIPGSERPAAAPDEPRSPSDADAASWASDSRLRRRLAAAVRAAADAARELVGRGDGDAVDAAAVHALRTALSGVPADLRVVSGEGEKDDAPMLHPGERFGTREGPALDLVVDPVDGTRLAASGRAGAMAILAVAPRGSFADLGPSFYLDKLVHAAADRDAGLALDAPVAENLARLAAAHGRPVSSLRVAVQVRPRNAAVVDAVRAAGARLHGFEHGDIERVVHAVASGGALDLLLGIGGAPEGLLEAAIVRAHGGVMRARFAPQSVAERDRVDVFSSGRGAEGAVAALASDRGAGLDALCAASALVVIAPVTPCALAPVRAPLVVVDESVEQEGGACLVTADLTAG